MTTAILSIATLLIGVVAGMWIYNTYIDGMWHKAFQRLSNNFRQTKSQLKELEKENESLRFQIEQHNIGRDEMKFTEQE